MDKKTLLSFLFIAIASNLYGMLPKQILDEHKIHENSSDIFEETKSLIQQTENKITRLIQLNNLSVQGKKTVKDWKERTECAKIWINEGMWDFIGRAYDEIASVVYEMHDKLDNYTALKIQECINIIGKLLSKIKAEKQKCEKPITIQFKDNLVEWMRRLEKIKLLNKSKKQTDIKKTYKKITFLLRDLQLATKDLW